MERTLTSQQISLRKRDLIDLASGYPLFSISDDVRGIVEESAGEMLDALSAGAVEKQAAISNHARDIFVQGARSALSIGELPTIIEVVLTGSLALDRILAALPSAANDRGKEMIHLLTMSPFFDLPALWMQDKASFRHTTIFRERLEERLPWKAISQGLELTASHELPVVLIASPDNPTGSVWSEGEISALSAACVQHGALLIVDHCFLLSGVQDPSSLVGVWSSAHSKCEWIGIWDTGKTIGLAGEKVALYVTNSFQLSVRINSAIEIVQLELPLLRMLIFGKLLNSDLWNKEIERLNIHSNQNLESLCETDLGSCRVHFPEGSTLAIIEFSDFDVEEAEVCEELAEVGVGVVGCRSFYDLKHHTLPKLRICLGREPWYFEKALAPLSKVLRSYV